MADNVINAVEKSLCQSLERVALRRIVIALSGGLDSRVLLHAAAMWRRQQAIKVPVCAIHVHHGLSPNADQWAAHCQHECDASDVPLIIAHVRLTDVRDGIEQSARLARYQAFEAHCQPGDVLLMAHHGDDQLETLLMRLSRGSGVNGMAAIPASRWLSDVEAVQIVRPFLGLRRAQLKSFAEDHGLSWVEDESNQNTQLERNWWRQVMLPQVEARFPGRSAAMLRSAQRLAEDADALMFLLQPYLERCLVSIDWPLVYSSGISVEKLLQQDEVLHGNLIRGWLKRSGLMMPSSAQMDEVLGAVVTAAENAHPKLTVGGAEGYVVRRYRGVLLACCPINQAPPDRVLSIPVSEQSDWLGKPLLGLDAMKPGEYLLTCSSRLAEASRQTIKSPGRPTKRLKKVWQEACVPPWLRPLWPLLLKDGRIQSVVGIMIDEDAAR